MECMTTTPGSAVESKGSMVCMIGGAGNFPSKIARTKSTPAIDAMTSVGVTPYSTLGLSSIGANPIYDGKYKLNQQTNHSPSWPGLSRPPTSYLTMLQRRGCPGQARA